MNRKDLLKLCKTANKLAAGFNLKKDINNITDKFSFFDKIKETFGLKIALLVANTCSEANIKNIPIEDSLDNNLNNLSFVFTIEFDEIAETITCPECFGAETYDCEECDVNGQMSCPGCEGYDENCEVCDGNERISCTSCGGAGYYDCGTCSTGFIESDPYMLFNVCCMITANHDLLHTFENSLKEKDEFYLPDNYDEDIPIILHNIVSYSTSSIFDEIDPISFKIDHKYEGKAIVFDIKKIYDDNLKLNSSHWSWVKFNSNDIYYIFKKMVADNFTK